MRSYIGSFSLVVSLFVSGCAAEAASSEPVEETPRLFLEEVDSPSALPDPAPFADDRDTLQQNAFLNAAATTDVSIESDDHRHLKATGGR